MADGRAGRRTDGRRDGNAGEKATLQSDYRQGRAGQGRGANTAAPANGRVPVPESECHFLPGKNMPTMATVVLAAEQHRSRIIIPAIEKCDQRCLFIINDGAAAAAAAEATLQDLRQEMEKKNRQILGLERKIQKLSFRSLISQHPGHFGRRSFLVSLFVIA